MLPLFFAVICSANAVGADTIRPKEEKRRQGSALHYIALLYNALFLECTLNSSYFKRSSQKGAPALVRGGGPLAVEG